MQTTMEILQHRELENGNNTSHRSMLKKPCGRVKEHKRNPTRKSGSTNQTA